MASDKANEDSLHRAFHAWLEDNGLSEFETNFTLHKINTLDRLVLIKNEEHLSRIGISSFGDQLQILDCIANYRACQAANVPPSSQVGVKRKLKQTTLSFGGASQPKFLRTEQESQPYDEYMYKDPKWPKTIFFNEITPKLYETYGKHLAKKEQNVLIRKERDARWERQETLRKVDEKIKTIFNPSYTGGFYNLLQKPSIPREAHIDHCKRGIKETEGLILQIDQEKAKTQELLGKCFNSLQPKKYMDEQITHYRNHLDQLRKLKEDLLINLHKLNNTLQELKSIFKVKCRNRAKSNESRKKKENRHKARVSKLKRAESSAHCVRQLLKKSIKEEWKEDNINCDNFENLIKKKHCHGLQFVLENDILDAKCKLMLKNKLDEWLYIEISCTSSSDSEEML